MHGTVAYGFAPVFSTDPQEYLRGVHAPDEGLDVADLAEMARFHVELARTGLARYTF